MTKVRTKRVRKKQWKLTWWRPTKDFVDGERPMMRVGTIREVEYKDQKNAWRGRARAWRPPYVAFARKIGRKQGKIVELEVFPENYSGE